MAITTADVKLFNAATVDGGEESGVEIVSGELNNLFPNISRVDRAAGELSIRKVYGRVTTIGNETYYSPHVILTDSPDQAGVDGFVFTTNNKYDDIGDAETYLDGRVVFTSLYAAVSSTPFIPVAIGNYTVDLAVSDEADRPLIGHIIYNGNSTSYYRVVNANFISSTGVLIKQNANDAEVNADNLKRYRIQLDKPLTNASWTSTYRTVTNSNYKVYSNLPITNISNEIVSVDSLSKQFLPAVPQKNSIANFYIDPTTIDVISTFVINPSSVVHTECSGTTYMAEFNVQFSNSSVISVDFYGTSSNLIASYRIFSNNTFELVSGTSMGTVALDRATGLLTWTVNGQIPYGVSISGGELATKNSSSQKTYYKSVVGDRKNAYSITLPDSPIGDSQVLVQYRYDNSWLVAYANGSDFTGAATGSVSRSSGVIDIVLSELPDSDSGIIVTYCQTPQVTTNDVPYLNNVYWEYDVPVGSSKIVKDLASHYYYNSIYSGYFVAGKWNLAGSDLIFIDEYHNKFYIKQQTGQTAVRQSSTCTIRLEDGTSVTIDHSKFSDSPKLFTTGDDALVPVRSVSSGIFVPYYFSTTKTIGLDLIINITVDQVVYTAVITGDLSSGSITATNGYRILFAEYTSILSLRYLYIMMIDQEGITAISASNNGSTLNVSQNTISYWDAYSGSTLPAEFIFKYHLETEANSKDVNSRGGVTTVGTASAYFSSEQDTVFKVVSTIDTSDSQSFVSRYQYHCTFYGGLTYTSLTTTPILTMNMCPVINSVIGNPLATFTTTNTVKQKFANPTFVPSVNSEWFFHYMGLNYKCVNGSVLNKSNSTIGSYDGSQVVINPNGAVIPSSSVHRHYSSTTYSYGLMCIDNSGIVTNSSTNISAILSAGDIKPGTVAISAKRISDNTTITGADNGSGVIGGDIYGTVNYLNGQVVCNCESVDCGTIIISAVNYDYFVPEASGVNLNSSKYPKSGHINVIAPGDLVVVYEHKTMNITSPAISTPYDTGFDNINSVYVTDSLSVVINTGDYTVDYDLGTVTFSNVSGYTAPFTVHYMIDDMAVVADLDGSDIVLSSAPTHTYTSAFISGALPFNDITAEVTSLHDLSTWNGTTWQDTAYTTVATANYDDVNYPIEVHNRHTIEQRWCLKFVSSTLVNVYGETLGLVAEGISIAGNIAPTNPSTGGAYFLIPSGGWGSGWATGNALRFNTVAPTVPLWVVRSTKPGQSYTNQPDSMTIQVRGDA